MIRKQSEISYTNSLSILIAVTYYLGSILAKLPMGLEVIDDKRSDPRPVGAELDCRASITQESFLDFAFCDEVGLSSDEERFDSAISDIQTLIRKNWEGNPIAYSDLRLLIITPNQWLRVYDGNMKLHLVGVFSSMEQLGRGPKIRGDLLDFFSKLEVLVKEIIQARTLGLFLFSQIEEGFEQFLQRAGFYNSIRLLNDWGAINGSLRGQIGNLNGIRNQLAHSWDESEVYYNKETRAKLSDNLVEFRKEAKEVWLELIKIHMKEEVKDIGNLMVKLGDYNTINAWNDITKERNEHRNIS